jgi:hypothetical protein
MWAVICHVGGCSKSGTRVRLSAPEIERSMPPRNSKGASCADETRTVLPATAESEMDVAEEARAGGPAWLAVLELLPHYVSHQLCIPLGERRRPLVNHLSPATLRHISASNGIRPRSARRALENRQGRKSFVSSNLVHAVRVDTDHSMRRSSPYP